MEKSELKINHRAIWVTWEKQRRNRELSKALEIELFELHQIGEVRNKFYKYLYGIFKTVRLILHTKPKLIFCQNPSLILALFLVLSKRFFCFLVCVDAHNAGLFPKEGDSVLLGKISKFVQKKTDITIVSNQGLVNVVEGNGGIPFVLPDKIPTIQVDGLKKLAGDANILFICTYSMDEPYELVFKVAKSFPRSTVFYVTGDYKGKEIEPNELPENIILTGYISEKEYCQLLASVDLTLDLTTRENCLVCGAYESLAVGKPMILSDTDAIRKYFCKGAVYAQDDVIGLSEAIDFAFKNYDVLERDVKDLAGLLNTSWDEKRNHLIKLLNNLL